MDERYGLQRLRPLRKLTQALAQALGADLRQHLSALSLLMRPRAVLGDFVDSGRKGEVRGADSAFHELRARYESVAGSRPFGLAREMTPPIEIVSSSPELTPLDYQHVASADGETRTVAVTRPLRWVLSYAGLSPLQLRELLPARDPDAARIKEIVVHALVLETVLSRQPGLLALLESLRFPVAFETLAGLGDLPVACVGSSLATLRPPDSVIVESTEISGLDAFEEVVDLDRLRQVEDPFRERLLGVIRAHAPDLVP